MGIFHLVSQFPRFGARQEADLTILLNERPPQKSCILEHSFKQNNATLNIGCGTAL
jgi:hypothetical protein